MSRPVALVTGASAGIGAQLARRLAERGSDLVLVARDGARLEGLAAEVRAQHGAEAEVLAADLTDAAQLAAVEARIAEPARPVETLANNAGFGTFGMFHELDVDGEEREIRLNVVALVRLTHAGAAAMVPRGAGGILNVSSLAAHQPLARNATYAATKAFVSSFTLSLHEELRGTGVRVTLLEPGFTRTEFQDRAGVDVSKVPSVAWQSADDVARAGLDGLDRGRAHVIPGAVNRFGQAATSLVPGNVVRRLGSVFGERAL